MNLRIIAIGPLCVGIPLMFQLGCGDSLSTVYFSREVDQELAAAAGAGDVDRIDAALAAGADVNAKGLGGITPLYFAYIERSNLVGFEELLKRGADPNIVFDSGPSILHKSARNARDSTWLRLALEYGGDPNVKEGVLEDGYDSGITPIFRAVESGRLENVTLLMEHGADVDVVDNINGYSPVVTAGHEGHPIIAKWLIEQGAKWDDVTTHGIGLAEAEVRHTFDEDTQKDEFEAHTWILSFLEMNGVDLQEAEKRSREIYGENFN